MNNFGNWDWNWAISQYRNIDNSPIISGGGIGEGAWWAPPLKTERIVNWKPCNLAYIWRERLYRGVARPLVDAGIYQDSQSKVECEARIEGAKRPSIEGEARVEGAKRPRIEGGAQTDRGRRRSQREKVRGGVWGEGSVSPSPEVFGKIKNLETIHFGAYLTQLF